MKDEQLIRGCIEKNLNAQKQLYDRFARKMMGVCLRYAGSKEEAEDILQEGFIKVFEKIETYRGECELEGWIKTVMINMSLDHFRKNKKAKNNVELNEEIGTMESNHYSTYDRLSEKELLETIQGLPPGFRTVFNLYAIEGYNHNEIGRMLQIEPGTSKSQYARARQHLQKIIMAETITE